MNNTENITFHCTKAKLYQIPSQRSLEHKYTFKLPNKDKSNRNKFIVR